MVAEGEALLGYHIRPRESYLLLATEVIRTMILPPFHSVYTVKTAKWYRMDLPLCILQPQSITSIKSFDSKQNANSNKSPATPYALSSTFGLAQFNGMYCLLSSITALIFTFT